MVRFGKTCQTPDDILKVINEFLQQADFPFEPPASRRCVKINQARDWFLDFEMIHIRDVFVYFWFLYVFVGVYGLQMPNQFIPWWGCLLVLPEEKFPHDRFAGPFSWNRRARGATCVPPTTKMQSRTLNFNFCVLNTEFGLQFLSVMPL